MRIGEANDQTFDPVAEKRYWLAVTNSEAVQRSLLG
jgi:hypothetical protein